MESNKICEHKWFKYCVHPVKSNDEPIICPYLISDIKIERLYSKDYFQMIIDDCVVFKPVKGLEGLLVFKHPLEDLK